ncbi:serine/threonine protein kinase [Edhazardia aedis USNM 41457]|uniref:non-specific serine/threonine protein kinase n=1 Tax=Edhazardia aedis (strain USNM 41457) TaxID=1003232 RepID=J9D3J5_EDHAE|nr:serine/threonine protein kinase [Edhazardia aedis USNM 41457]|eukprot:EJW02109.1 serine/threonine protein kinase [Edhazardia aedis USNM 41457]
MEKYVFLEKIGRGTHGTVYLMQGENGNVVCKTITEKNTKYALREINILTKLNCRRIIKLIEHFKHENTFYLILEHANHNSLENVINYHKKNNISMNEDNFYTKIIWNMFAQIADAIYYLHSKKIIHRDIKPSNILINQYFTHEEVLEFKLCDFSLSTPFNGVSTNLVGTPFYMAPEILKKEQYDGCVDIWSLGVVLFEMVALKRPFNGRTRKDLQSNVLKNTIEDLPNCEDSLLKNLILQCLQKDQKDRITSVELRKIDKIKYLLALAEIRTRDRRIIALENKLKENELSSSYLPSPNESTRKSENNENNLLQ